MRASLHQRRGCTTSRVLRAPGHTCLGRQIPDRIVTCDVRGESPPLRVLLVDWPHHGLPSALIAAGARVFGLSPRTGALGMFIAGTPGEDGHLFFRRLHGR